MATYKLIASNTVGSAVTSVTFSSIPSTYTDLVVKFSARTTQTGSLGNASDISLQFNAVTSGYSSRLLYANVAVASPTSASNSGSSIVWGGNATNADATANTFGNGEMTIPNYVSANYKSVSIDSVSENNSTNATTELVAGLWSNTAAITSITLTPGAGNFVQYSTFTLYGISNA